MTVNKKDITKDTKLSVVVTYLEQVVKDRHPREEQSSFETAKGSGKFEIIDMLKGMCGR